MSDPSQLPLYDVVIAGAGPAGAMAALVLARAGRRVIVLEKMRWPREKVCGDCINPSAWEIWRRHGLEEEFGALPHHLSAGVCLESAGRELFRHDFAPGPHFGPRAVRRSDLDEWVMGRAIAAGAEFHTEISVTAVDTTTGVITTTQGDYHGRMILGADGRNSTIARMAGLTSSRPGRCGRLAWQTTLDASAVDGHVHMNLFPDGYYGLVRINEKSANMCIVMSRHSKATPQSVLSRYIPNTRPCTWRSVTPITRAPSTLGRGRVWLAGDAARMVEPFTGEGIYFALASGEAAADAILHTLNGLDATPVRADACLRKGLATYQSSHAALYGKRVWVNQFVHWCALRPALAMRAVRVLSAIPGALGTLVRWVHPAPPPHAAS
ncbi:hypothetical protein DB346_12025 [Verrucomicrobia bacterium LW23]|nr:hypothetical protein DB346_12025 [Verrucomicrobia bacterium LW23]